MKRVLLVEDHRSFSDSLAEVLNREPGLRVVGRTASAAECREFMSGGDGYDLALVDLFLPDSRGAELVAELRESCPQAPVLVLTISLDPEDRQQALEAGADAVISKTASLEEILAAIHRLEEAG
jgi:DNA-binding NarL/FixJ family response regulator